MFGICRDLYKYSAQVKTLYLASPALNNLSSKKPAVHPMWVQRVEEELEAGVCCRPVPRLAFLACLHLGHLTHIIRKWLECCAVHNVIFVLFEFLPAEQAETLCLDIPFNIAPWTAHTYHQEVIRVQRQCSVQHVRTWKLYGSRTCPSQCSLCQ